MLKQNGFLYYYPDSQCKAEKGRVDIVNMERVCTYEAGIGDKLPDPSSMDRSLVIVTQDRNYTLVFDTDHECRLVVYNITATLWEYRHATSVRYNIIITSTVRYCNLLMHSIHVVQCSNWNQLIFNACI